MLIKIILLLFLLSQKTNFSKNCIKKMIYFEKIEPIDIFFGDHTVPNGNSIMLKKFFCF